MEDKDMSSYMVNTVVADGFAIWGAMASTYMIST